MNLPEILFVRRHGYSYCAIFNVLQHHDLVLPLSSTNLLRWLRKHKSPVAGPLTHLANFAVSAV